MKVYIAMVWGNWPEDGDKVLDVYHDEEQAEEVAKEFADDNSHWENHGAFERELIE